MNLDNNTIIHIEDNLSKPTNLLETISPNEYKKNYKYLISSIDSDLIYYGDHPVFCGFINAYKEHRPITISPDIIWLLIVQGFSQHVLNNSEQLRTKFVTFEGKKELRIVRKDLTPSDATVEDWNEVFSQFTEEIGKYTGNELIKVLTPSFSTTTPVSVAVGQLSIMCSMKNYFYNIFMMVSCGIPFVTVEGSIEDWEDILNRINYLEKYDLSFWINEIRPIIIQIINSKKGQIDKDFWYHMIRLKNAEGFYQPDIVDGWFIKFFPYSSTGKKNSLVSLNYKPSALPSEVQDVPFELNLIGTSSKFNMKFYGGFVGMKQNPLNFSLKPEIGWFIKENKQDE